jgi:very-short-patch-repair endonuclease
MTGIPGTERQVGDTPLVPIGGKLPYVLEVKTSQLIDVLSAFTPDKAKDFRKKAGAWLYSRTRPGFYLEMNAHLHLAYADQRDGHNTQHYWRLFFDEQVKEKIERASRGSVLVVGAEPKKNQANSGVRAEHSWFGMYFRSRVEMKMAQELQKRDVTFFANARGCYSLEDSPVSAQYFNGRVEVDFLIFHKGKCIILQIDGPQHNGDRSRDYAGDRLMLREGILTVRFTANECQEKPGELVSEVLGCLNYL